MIVAMAFATGCAKRGMPEGGPPDTTAPEIVRTVPAGGAVNVPRTATLVIEFSKLVNRTTVTTDLSVSPPLAGTPDVRWSGRTATMRWADTLRADVTYRFSFGSKLTDIHANRLKEPITIAFSTGSKIDSCRIRGQIWTTDPVTVGLNIMAYQIDSSHAWPRKQADYVSQAGTGGQFDLPYLPPAVYRLMAVGDKNRNGRPDQNELFGLATSDLDLRTRIVAEGVKIFTRPFDTTAFKLEGCSQTADGSLLVGLTHPADTSRWTGATFRVLDSVSRESLATTALRPVPPKLVTIPLLGDQFVAGHTYEVITYGGHGETRQVVRDNDGQTLTTDSCRVMWGKTVDSVGPRVLWTVLPTVENATSPASPFEIGFNEPVDTVASHEALKVRDTLGHDLAGIPRWLDPRHLTFTPSPRWPDSMLLAVASLDSAHVFDRHGNLAPAQVRSWKFRPLIQSQMGGLAGRIEVSDSTWSMASCHLEARPTSKGKTASLVLEKPGSFEMNLPAGRWILGGYIDLDHDGRWSGGQIQPYSPAEPRMLLSDTVTVRARFTQEGIVIRF